MTELNSQLYIKGCFEGTLIETPDGDKAVETLQAGDSVTSYNESTRQRETSQIGSIEVLERSEYYVINGIINVTAEHQFYTDTNLREVKDIRVGHRLIGRYEKTIPVMSVRKVQADVTVYNLLEVMPNNNYYANRFLVHNKC